MKESCASCGNFCNSHGEESAFRYYQRGNYCERCNIKSNKKLDEKKPIVPERFGEILDSFFEHD